MNFIADLNERFPQITFPEIFLDYTTTQSANDHQIRRLNPETDLFSFLESLEAPSTHLNRFISAESRICTHVDFPQLLTHTPTEIYTYLVDHFAHIFDLQQIALDSELATGFNKHGNTHVAHVTRQSLNLLRQQNPLANDPLTEKLAVIGGLFHDIGNLIGRKYHSLYGIYLASRIFEKYDQNAETYNQFLTVLEIIMFHEVEFGQATAVFDNMHPATLSTIIADKTDIGFHRVSSKSNVEDAVDDAHVVVNLLISDSQLERLPDTSGRFRWTLDFQPRFDDDQSELFSRLLKASGRVKYPQDWKDLYEEGNIEYLFLFQAVFFEIYLSRIFLTLRAIFTLFPSVETVSIVIIDKERQMSLNRDFSKATYPAQVALLGKLFNRDKWQETSLFRALAQLGY